MQEFEHKQQESGRTVPEDELHEDRAAAADESRNDEQQPVLGADRAKEADDLQAGQTDLEVAGDEEAEASAASAAQDEPIDREPSGTICIICKEKKSAGMSICGEFICLECEEDMVHTEVSDAKYPYFVTQMKQIWYQKNA